MSDAFEIPGNQTAIWFTDNGTLSRLDFDPPGEPKLWWVALTPRQRAVCLALLAYSTENVRRGDRA